MNHPKIEYKNRRERPRPRRDTTISLLEAQCRKHEQQAREMLYKLETALVNCGYVRDGIYNSRQAKWSTARERTTVIIWERGKILLGLGLKKGRDGVAVKPYEAVPPLSIGRMGTSDLARVASNLAPFIDSLEDNVRHQIKVMEDAALKMQEILGRVEDAPLPSDTPAQMSENLDVEIPDESGE